MEHCEIEECGQLLLGREMVKVTDMNEPRKPKFYCIYCYREMIREEMKL